MNIPRNFKKYNGIQRYDSSPMDTHFGRLNLNENCFGPSTRCLEILNTITSQEISEYDTSSTDVLREEISKSFNMPIDEIIIQGGSSEIINNVFEMSTEKGDCVLLPNPSWGYFEGLSNKKELDKQYYSIGINEDSFYIDTEDLIEKAKKYKPALIIVNSPHNPTGCCISEQGLEELLLVNPDSVVLLDEAYYGFEIENININRLVEKYSNLIVSRSFSKFYGLAGVRIAFAFCNSSTKRILELNMPLFKESIISRKMACAALQDKQYYEENLKKINEIKTKFYLDIKMLSDKVIAYQTSSNFIPLSIENVNMLELQDFLKRNGIHVKLFDYNNKIFARISIAKLDEMDKLVLLLKKYIG